MPGDRGETRIRLTRMHPTSTGYRLIKDVDENDAEKIPQKTPQEINDEFDEGELALLKVRQWQIRDAQRHYAQMVASIWIAYHDGMAELGEKRQAALAQCAQGEAKNTLRQ